MLPWLFRNPAISNFFPFPSGLRNSGVQLYLLWSKFLLEKMLAVFLFVGTYFCRSLEKLPKKLKKLEPAKILCHTVYLLIL